MLRPVSGKPPAKPSSENAVGCSHGRSPTLLQADKKGGFVPMPKDLFGTKAMQAAESNSRSLQIRHAGGVPVEIFKKLSVQSRKWFFAAAKTHKSVCPHRVTIWERQLATPGLFPSEFSRWGLENAPVQCATTAFSALLHTSGPVLFAKGCKFAEKFQSAAGINSQQFLGSLQFHFKSIAILFENGLYECRGSSVAPALCDIWQTV